MKIVAGQPPQANSFRTARKRPIVGVMGGSRLQDKDVPRQVGHWLGGTGYDLLTGAGGGTMESVSAAFAVREGRTGLVIGIVPGGLSQGDVVYATRSADYPNPYVEVAVFTHLPTTDDLTGLGSRNPINVLTSDVVVVLPGSDGTAAELDLAVTLCKSVIVYVGAEGTIGGLSGKAIAAQYGEDVTVVASLEALARAVQAAMAALGYH